MNVIFSEEVKKVFSQAEIEKANVIIKMLENDSNTIEDYARETMKALGYDDKFEIFRPVANISKNFRANNVFNSNSGTLDVWITFLAFSDIAGVFDCGIYLSDLIRISVNLAHSKTELKRKMYLSRFVKVVLNRPTT